MALFRFEHRSTPMASTAVFMGRVARSTLFASALIIIALVAGIYGYMRTEHMSLLDAYLNSAMLLGGMGPVSQLQTDDGKFFAGTYALVCGLLIVIASGVVLAPILHRVLHALHVEREGDPQE
jgi:hypothetical protein